MEQKANITIDKDRFRRPSAHYALYLPVSHRVLRALSLCKKPGIPLGTALPQAVVSFRHQRNRLQLSPADHRPDRLLRRNVFYCSRAFSRLYGILWLYHAERTDEPF